jgi:hypothetical protein
MFKNIISEPSAYNQDLLVNADNPQKTVTIAIMDDVVFTP